MSSRCHRISAFPTLVLTLLALTALEASAFPSWMGVYGSFQRHNGVYPGKFMILMNQDYWGLHAEVVVRVNGGSWTAYNMNYAGNISGNSIWEYSHGHAFPTNATVQYYFHGWDNWGGNIWDSNGGANYSFTAGPGQLTWIGNTYHWPTNGAVMAGHDLWINTETWPRGSATNAIVYFNYLGGTNWMAAPLSLAGVQGNNDWWHRNMGRFSAGAVIQYSVGACDGLGDLYVDNRGGSNYFANVATGGVAAWIGNARHWPTNGALSSTNILWADIEAAPTNSTVGGAVTYSVNGYAWFDEPLTFYQVLGGSNEWWHANLGDMPPGATVYYVFRLEDGTAAWHTRPTFGVPLSATVLGSSTDADGDFLPDDWELYWWGSTTNGGLGNADGDGVTGLPLTDYHEWVIGTDPAFSNRHDVLPLIWFPDRPFKGGWVKLSFHIATNSAFYAPPHTVRINQGVGITNRQLSQVASSGNRWEAVFKTATNAGSLSLVLLNGSGVTNNNFTLAWTVPIRTLGGAELADSDKDGLPDAWEELYGLDPLDSGALNYQNGPEGDVDGDGATNLQEYQAGTDPTVFNPMPTVTIVYPKQGGVLP